MSRLSNPPPHRYTGAGFDRAAHRRLRRRMAQRAPGGPANAGHPDVRPRGAGQRERPAVRRDSDGRAARATASRGGDLPRRGGRRRPVRHRFRARRRAERSVRRGAHGRRLAVGEGGRLVRLRARAGILAQPAPLLRRVRRRHGQRPGRPYPALPDLRRPALPAQRPGGDRAGRPIATPSTASAACSAARPAFRPASTRPLPGFVEPGESLEETVRREVYEESGIEVADIAVPLVAALAVPGLTDARLSGHGARRHPAHRSRRAGRCRLVHPRPADRSRALPDQAAEPRLDRPPPDRGLAVREGGTACAVVVARKVMHGRR